MSDTPRTDARVKEENPIGIPGNTAVISTEFARQLERELERELATGPPADGGPAFPRSSQGSMGDLDFAFGMSLRDYLAARALEGLLSNPDCALTVVTTCILSYEYADEMLKARKVKP